MIDDPFDDIVTAPEFVELVQDAVPQLRHAGDCANFVERWRDANRKIDFRFASHFAQEEVWIQKALHDIGTDDRALLVSSVSILGIYRSRLSAAISSQRSLPIVRQTLQWLRSLGVQVHLASNDRRFATPAFVRWAGLDPFVDRIFVSEELCESVPRAEKPNAEFFLALLDELGVRQSEFHCVAYVGDSERNDIEPALKLGLVAVRYINPKSDQSKIWLDSDKVTKARYVYGHPIQLKDLLGRMLLDMGGFDRR